MLAVTAKLGRFRRVCCVCTVIAVVQAGCASHKPVLEEPMRPDLSPQSSILPEETLQLDASQIKPMYTEMFAIDLSTVAHLALADNLEVQHARQNVVASQGRLESTVGAAFPAIVPTAVFENVEGTVRATEGDLVGVGFSTFQPSIALQWIINPGQVYYDILAAKKRLSASRFQERSVQQQTLHRATRQFYDLVYSQAQISAMHQGVMEAQELHRITKLSTQTGVGVLADDLHAEARLAQRRQAFISALKSFYDASVALNLTLHLDVTVTLVPKLSELPPTRLVRDDVEIEVLLGYALAFRPDLKRVRELMEAITADTGSTWWGGYGPQFEAGYEYGGITANTNNIVDADNSLGDRISGTVLDGLTGGRLRNGRDDQTYAFSDQQRANASVGWRFTLASIGDLKTAGAKQVQASIDAERALDQVRSQVVLAAQASKANSALVTLSNQQVVAAAEALRLSEANLRAGAMTTLDVLQTQDTVTQARLSYAAAVVRFNQSQVDLLAALGLIDISQFVSSDVEN